MTWTSLRTASAIWVGTLLGIYLGGWLQAQPSPEGALGRYPLPPIVGMTQTCPGYLLATGVLQEHNDVRYFSISNATLLLHPDGIPAMHVRNLLGQKVDLVVRPVEPLRERKALTR